MVDPPSADISTTSTSGRSEANDGAPPPGVDAHLGGTADVGAPQAQTIWILIFTGQPRDIQSTRITELYIAFNEDESTNVTIRLQGQHPNFTVNETWNEPHPRMRQNFHRRLAITTLMTTGPDIDLSVRDTIWSTPVNNAEPDWTCQSWVGDVVTTLQDADLITVEEGDNALNGMVNYISRAPWR